MVVIQMWVILTWYIIDLNIHEWILIINKTSRLYSDKITPGTKGKGSFPKLYKA